MTLRLPSGRAVAATIAALLLGAGLYALIGGCQMWWRCSKAAAAEMAAFPDAFARAGTYEADVRLEYTFTCKEMLRVEYSPPSRSPEELAPLTEGLEATLRITRPDGTVAYESPFEECLLLASWARASPPAVYPALPFRPLKAGDYHLAIAVREPAPRLAAIPHRVVLRYELCGIEWLAAYFGLAVGLVLLLAGGASAAMLVWVMRQRKIRLQPAASPAPADLRA